MAEPDKNSEKQDICNIYANVQWQDKWVKDSQYGHWH
jgi:AAA+ superfamily predicted ATPase